MTPNQEYKQAKKEGATDLSFKEWLTEKQKDGHFLNASATPVVTVEKKLGVKIAGIEVKYIIAAVAVVAVGFVAYKIYKNSQAA